YLIFPLTMIRGADTTLIDVFEYSERIHSIARDVQWGIFVALPSGLYQMSTDNGSLQSVDRNFLGDIYFEDSLITFNAQSPPPVIARFQKITKSNLVWLNHLPQSDHQTVLTVAVDGESFHYVASNYHIYKFKVEEAFEKILPVYSVRAIEKCNDTLFFNTYSGLFKNKINHDPSFIGGDLFVTKSREFVGTSGKRLRRITASGTDSLDLGSSFQQWIELTGANTTQLEQTPHGGWLVGTDNGLAVVSNDSTRIFLKNIVIEHILPHQNEYILSTSRGVAFFRPDGQIRWLGLTGKHCNQAVIIGGQIFVATDNGLQTYDMDKEEWNSVRLRKNPVVVVSMVKDANGFLWCGTYTGLYKIDPYDSSYEIFLPQTEFNKRAYYSDEECIIMGAINGAYLWKPSALSDSYGMVHPQEGILKEVSASQKVKTIFIALILLLFITSGLAIRESIARARLRSRIPNSALEEQTKLQPTLDGPSFRELVETYINDHISTVSVNSLCEYLGLTKRAFYKYFHKHYRELPGNIIRDRRKALVLKSRQQNPSLTIRQLGELVGYSDRHIINILEDNIKK
ncbi:MAG: hypothetical protein ACO4CH_12685, partial [Saprospiraceae bacterium]